MHFRVTCHTDHVGPGSTFVVIRGTRVDGLLFVPEAIARGASTVVLDETAVPDSGLIELCYKQNICIERVTDTRKALAELSAQAYGYPANKLKIIAVTGTKGKTTSVFTARDLLRSQGKATAMISGVKNYIGDRELPANLTTPQPDYVHWFFNQCVQAGVEYVVMEASAQAHTLHRLHGLVFVAVIFTNFSQEHAEFYDSQEAYFADKCAFVEQVVPGAPMVLNGDDAWVARLDNEMRVSFGTGVADYQFTINQAGMQGISLTLRDRAYTWTIATDKFAGEYNCYNLVGVLVMLHELGFDMQSLIDHLDTLGSVPGRLERLLLANGATAIIDYAHTPSSYQALLSLLRANADQLIVVFGCGGHRDATKRPIMGNIAAQYADLIILTSDNPRTEDNAAIVADIQRGIDGIDAQVHVEHDRALAISYAIEQAQSGALIVILGKGPDEYQIIGTTKNFFSDRMTVAKYTSTS